MFAYTLKERPGFAEMPTDCAHAGNGDEVSAKATKALRNIVRLGSGCQSSCVWVLLSNSHMVKPSGP